MTTDGERILAELDKRMKKAFELDKHTEAILELSKQVEKVNAILLDEKAQTRNYLAKCAKGHLNILSECEIIRCIVLCPQCKDAISEVWFKWLQLKEVTFL